MLPRDQDELSRRLTHPEGDPHLPLPGIRDIFGLEATGARERLSLEQKGPSLILTLVSQTILAR
jgi:hypothetical protein